MGLSRQRVNEALRALQAAEVIRIEYGGLRVLDLERLRRYGQSGVGVAPGRVEVEPGARPDAGAGAADHGVEAAASRARSS